MSEGAGPTFDEPGFDVIGDAHGHVEQLQKLLKFLVMAVVGLARWQRAVGRP